MKKILVLITVATVFAACNTTPKVPVVVVDTLAIRQKAVLEEQVRVLAEKDSLNRAANLKRERREARNEASRNNQSAAGYQDASAETPAPAAAKKKGWSAAAKGTAIGGGVGAIAGGIIGHNLGGAAIGAVAGGGAGYLIGRAKDRKTGRVVKKVDTTRAPKQ